MAASPKPREATPQPVIGKVGRHTVFITPPPTPRPFSISPGKGSAIAPTTGSVQNAYSSLDEYLADWFGLNQSKYQWALNDYYENKGLGTFIRTIFLSEKLCFAFSFLWLPGFLGGKVGSLFSS
ncbi:hypothetical protein J5N97_025997 [Dioscorea zingiberensis]|uniref:Uncharacterized protein n=1 Tax=Dioscorea zingiberensis TaxID=325984 RepID=A0A9D5C1X9_9LILI|nr:hypothetical protein J5N97_025997 [Dioscorea zingiberensis]